MPQRRRPAAAGRHTCARGDARAPAAGRLVSRNSVASWCVRRIDAGAIGDTSPSTHIRTATALRDSGTIATIARAFRICRIDIEIARWHVADRREPPFAHLLTATRIVELDDEIRALGVEIRGRIVECEVAVLADADERDIHRLRRPAFGRDPRTPRAASPLTVDQMERYDSGRFNQPFAQVLPKARRMIARAGPRIHRDETVRPSTSRRRLRASVDRETSSATFPWLRQCGPDPTQRQPSGCARPRRAPPRAPARGDRRKQKSACPAGESITRAESQRLLIAASRPPRATGTDRARRRFSREHRCCVTRMPNHRCTTGRRVGRGPVRRSRREMTQGAASR